MKVPLLDLHAQLETIRPALISAVTSVIDSGRYIMGPEVEELERKVADYCGTKFGIGVSSGTDALLIALMALDVGPGDIVITSPYSFFATAGVVARLNATPVFVDIDEASFNICSERLAEWLATNKDKISRVKAIIPVHLYGQCADMDSILKVAGDYNIPVIEDGAQAIGALYPSKIGTTKQADRKACSMGLMGCLSFFPSKNLGCLGDGGMVVTNDEATAEKLRLLRTHGAKPKYYHSIIGGNFRLDTIQAAALLVKLPLLDQWHERRRENARYYDEHIKISGVTLPKSVYGRGYHIYNQYVIMVRDRRDELRKYLNEVGIGNEVYYPVSFHEQECFRNLGYKHGDFPISEKAARHSLAIPIYPELTTEMQNYVIANLEKFYG